MDSLLNWVGGKRLLREKIVTKIPPHRCYVEPFGGGGWVLFHKKRSEVEVYNDLNAKLFTLFMCVKYHPEELVKELNFFLGSRKLFNALRQQSGLTEIQKAARFLFLIKLSFGGMGESFGTVRLSGGGLGPPR